MATPRRVIHDYRYEAEKARLAQLAAVAAQRAVLGTSRVIPPYEREPLSAGDEASASGVKVALSELDDEVRSMLTSPGVVIEYDNGASGAAKAINWQNGVKQRLTVTAVGAVVTLSASVIGNYLLRIIQGPGGNKTIAWGTPIKWTTGVVPTLSIAAGAVDIISFYYDGSAFYGVASYNFS